MKEHEYWFIQFNKKSRKFKLLDRYTTFNLKEAKKEFEIRNKLKKGNIYTISKSVDKVLIWN